MRTMLTADWLIGFDGKGHVLWPNGQIVFADDSIVFVGRDFPGDVDHRMDYGRALISPGFVDLDALGDLDTEVLTFDNGPGAALGRVWTEDALRRGTLDCYSPEEEVFKYRYAFTQLIRNGITTALPITSMLYRGWAESYDEMAGVAAVAAEMGMRAYLGPCYKSGTTYQKPDGSRAQHWDLNRGMAGLDDAAQFIADFDGHASGLIRTFLAPDRIETQLPEVLARTARVQAETGVPMRLHCCQSVSEFELVRQLRGATPLGWLEQLGLLSERSILPHGIYLAGHPAVSPGGGDDMARLVGSGATVAHCPLVFARDGERLEFFARYRANGVRFGMGTDTFPPDMIENIRLGHMLSALTPHDPPASAADFFTAATIGGADALGRPDLGRLCTGAKADIAVFDLGGFHLGQVIDPLKSLVLAGSGRDTRDVFINGRQVMADYQSPGSDLADLTLRGDALIRKAMAIHGDRAPGRPAPEAMFKPAFPLAR